MRRAAHMFFYLTVCSHQERSGVSRHLHNLSPTFRIGAEDLHGRLFRIRQVNFTNYILLEIIGFDAYSREMILCWSGDLLFSISNSWSFGSSRVSHSLTIFAEVPPAPRSPFRKYLASSFPNRVSKGNWSHCRHSPRILITGLKKCSLPERISSVQPDVQGQSLFLRSSESRMAWLEGAGWTIVNLLESRAPSTCTLYSSDVE